MRTVTKCVEPGSEIQNFKHDSLELSIPHDPRAQTDGRTDERVVVTAVIVGTESESHRSQS